MQSFIQTFSTLLIEPPSIADLIPTDLTAVMPAKQIYYEHQYDDSQESQIVRKKVSKLINILERKKTQENTLTKESKTVHSSKNSKDFKEEKQFQPQLFESQEKNENMDYINRIKKKPQKICELMKIQYRKNPHFEVTPVRKKLDLPKASHQHNIQVRRVTPKSQKPRTPKRIQNEKKKIELLNSFALKQEQDKIMNELSQLQSQLQTVGNHNSTPLQKMERQIKDLQFKSKNAKTVKLDISPLKLKTDKLQKKNYKEQNIKKSRSKKLLLTDRINKAIRS